MNKLKKMALRVRMITLSLSFKLPALWYIGFFFLYNRLFILLYDKLFA